MSSREASSTPQKLFSFVKVMDYPYSFIVCDVCLTWCDWNTVEKDVKFQVSDLSIEQETSPYNSDFVAHV